MIILVDLVHEWTSILNLELNKQFDTPHERNQKDKQQLKLLLLVLLSKAKTTSDWVNAITVIITGQEVKADIRHFSLAE